MLSKLSKYIIEIAVGITIFVVIISFLPNNTIDIPQIEDLQLSGMELSFVMDEEPDAVYGQEETTPDETVIVAQEDVLPAEVIEIPMEIIPYESIDEILSLIAQSNSSTNTGIIVSTNTGITQVATGKDQEPIYTPPMQSCVTPRGARIEHGASVLAYQQRSDDAATCNIQRRTCDDGTLNGSYTQSSCKEYFGFNAEKQEVVAYNIPYSNPYIQPKPLNTTQTNTNNTSSSIFPSRPTGGSSLSNTTTALVSDYNYASSSVPAQGVTPFVDYQGSSTTSSTINNGSSCVAPSGTIIGNGQFVKAYKFNNGFSNLPCEVELRYCVQGSLQGSFVFPSCIHNDIAVEDFLDGYFDPNRPSLMQLIQVLYAYARTPQFQYEYDPIIDLQRLLQTLENLR